MPQPHAILLGALMLAASLTRAAQPLITDDAGTIGAGTNQFEFSYNEDQATQAGATTRTRALPLVYARGLTEALDGFIQANEGGSGNPSFGFKWRFYENEKSGTSLALKPEVRISINPAGEPSPGQARTTLGVTAILTQEVPFGAVHVNVFTNQDRFRNAAAFPEVARTRISVAPVWDVADGWKLALDLGIENTRTGGMTTRADITEIGAIWSPAADFDFALGFVHKIANDTPRTTTLTGTAGVTWRF